MAQYFGLTLIAIGLLTQFARNVTDSGAHRAIILALLVSDDIGIIMLVIGKGTGLIRAVGRSTVVIYLFFSAGL